ncbi:MAG: hypothetical protein EOM18_13710 [Clostridia bacterium]|nr:hypothetical protein [Clostridia bacterium]
MRQEVVKIDKNIKLGHVYNLSERLQKIYWTYVDAIACMKEKVESTLKEDEISLIFSAIKYDYPELFMIWHPTHFRYSLKKVKGQTIRIEYMEYTASRAYLEAKLQLVEVKAKEIIMQCTNGKASSDKDIAKKLYNYMLDRYEFSEKADGKKSPPYAYTLECMLHNEGVCQGLSFAYMYMLRKLQIPAMVVEGVAYNELENGGHAWNIIQFGDGRYWQADLSWDIGENNRGRAVYWGLTDNEMENKGHSWKKEDYPICS